MALIQTLSPDKTEGKIRAAFERCMENPGVIPRPSIMMQGFQVDRAGTTARADADIAA